MTLEQACPSEYQWAQCAFKDSMTHGNSAIRITYRISLRSSSMPEPRDPLLKVLFLINIKVFRRQCLVPEFLCWAIGGRALQSWKPTTGGQRDQLVKTAGPPKQLKVTIDTGLGGSGPEKRP